MHSTRFSLRRWATAVLSFVLALALAAGASADSVHFKKGSPSFSDNGTTLTLAGTLAGLGNGPYRIDLVARGVAHVTCTNQGGNAAPGRNPVYRTVSGSLIIGPEDIRNGTSSFSLTTGEPAPATAREAGCPNNNWTATIDDVKFTYASINIYDANTGKLVLSYSKSF